MRSVELVRELLAFSHTSLEIRFEECPAERLFFFEEGSPVGSVAAIYAHAVIGEDTFVSRRSGEPALFEADDWPRRFGFEPQAGLDIAWTKSLQYDPAEFQEYAARVYARSDAWLASLDDTAVERLANVWMVENVHGKPRYREAQKPLLYVFMDNVTLHHCEHTGEIAASVGRMKAGLS